MPCHVFQASTPSPNSTKDRADGLCVKLCANIFVGCLVTPYFFFFFFFPFLILSVILKNKKNLYVGSFLIICQYTLQIRSNWYMDTGVHDLELAAFKANST